jgi:hypothetical protein
MAKSLSTSECSLRFSFAMWPFGLLTCVLCVVSFHKWLKSDKGIKSSKGAQLGMLRMKLQSKAWIAKLADLRSKYGKKQDAKCM